MSDSSGVGELIPSDAGLRGSRRGAVERRTLILAAFVAGADQMTKYAAHRSESSTVIVPVLNPDYALGLFSSHPLLLSLGMVMAVALVTVWHRRTASSSTRPWWIVPLFLAGAVSNLVDRLALGAVRDFVSTPWIVFNLADVAILIAIAAFYRDLASQRHRKEVTP